MDCYLRHCTVHQFQPDPTHKIHYQQQMQQFSTYPPMRHLSNDDKDCPNHHKNSHELCSETRHPVSSMMERQRKLRQPHDQNILMEGELL